MKLWK